MSGERMIDVAALNRQLKNQINFFKWMSRRHLESNPEQSQAFTVGAEKLQDLRQELKAGKFDAGDVLVEELFTLQGDAGQAADELDIIDDMVEAQLLAGDIRAEQAAAARDFGLGWR